MRPTVRYVLPYFAVMVANIGLAAQQAAQVHAKTLASVAIAYCGATPRKPPLEELHFRISLHNKAAHPEWILLPNGFYSHATRYKDDSGISTVELLSDESRSVKLLRFLGSTRIQPEVANDTGGFQAVLVGGTATVTLPLVIDFWGRPDGPLPITALIARDIRVQSKPIDRYFQTPLLSNPNSVTKPLIVIDHWSTQDLAEVPIKIERVGKVAIRDAFAAVCESGTR